MFYQYILKEKDETLIKRFYQAQSETPGKNNWVLTVRKSLEELEIFIDEDDIKKCSEYEFKHLVDKAVEELCLKYLIVEKNKRQKVKHIKFNKLKTQSYLLPGKLSIQESKKIFLLRTRMLETKDNFPNNFSDDICPLCENTGEMMCQSLKSKSIVKQVIR